MTSPPDKVLKRLETEANMWIACVRPDGRPHLTPVWFAWYEGNLYACIQSQSVKARNIQENPHVSLALENGSQPLICEGTAVLLPPPWPDDIARIFQAKYDWNITTDGSYDRLLEMTPTKWLAW